MAAEKVLNVTKARVVISGNTIFWKKEKENGKKQVENKREINRKANGMSKRSTVVDQ